MSILQHYGKPSVFVTMTCSPKWPEIVNELLPGQTSTDRPDLCARVFKLKHDKLMKLLTVDGVLGKVKAHVNVIEFQKRGLPHSHILLTFVDEDKPIDSDDVDSMVCAEIPDRSIDPEL
jgi:hypothetical protein